MGSNVHSPVSFEEMENEENATIESETAEIPAVDESETLTSNIE